MGKLDGKIAVITGASSGIGKQTAIRFAKEGANIAICARREEKLMETARICEEAGAEVLPMICDVTQQKQIERFVSEINERFGKIDILINNAASVDLMIPFIEQTHENLDKAIKSELYATWDFMQLCFPLMKERGGSIINFGSRAAQGLPNQASYSVSKAAVIALSHVAAIELGQYNIRVNTIVPVCLTDSASEAKTEQEAKIKEVVLQSVIAQSPLHRISTSEDDVVPVILFLASEDSRWITGQDIRAEGGMDIHW